jgi:hypothetical protein
MLLLSAMIRKINPDHAGRMVSAMMTFGESINIEITQDPHARG